jgi:hypothetical protein
MYPRKLEDGWNVEDLEIVKYLQLKQQGYLKVPKEERRKPFLATLGKAYDPRKRGKAFSWTLSR